MHCFVSYGAILTHLFFLSIVGPSGWPKWTPSWSGRSTTSWETGITGSRPVCSMSKYYDVPEKVFWNILPSPPCACQSPDNTITWLNGGTCVVYESVARMDERCVFRETSLFLLESSHWINIPVVFLFSHDSCLCLLQSVIYSFSFSFLFWDCHTTSFWSAVCFCLKAQIKLFVSVSPPSSLLSSSFLTFSLNAD